MLLDAFLRWDDFYIMDCTSETLSVKDVVDLGPEVPRAVSDEMWVPFLEQGVTNEEVMGNGKLQDSPSELRAPKPWPPCTSL